MERILVVEDDKNIRELIRLNLQLAGYSCEVCRDGREMEESLNRGQFALILLDVMLPGLSGFDLIGKCSGTPVIYVTAKGELQDKVQGLTPREYSLLEVLVTNQNIALSRDKLLELAWGYDYEGETKTVDVHIQRLRKKLGWENYIRTVIKLGYRLETRM